MRFDRLKRLVDPARPITYGIVQAGPEFEGGIPYIRPADMTDETGVKDFGSIKHTSPEIAQQYRRSAVKTGDLVISIGPSFGKVMEVPSELEGANLTQGTARVAPGPSLDARFAFWCLRSQHCYSQWEASIGGATFRALNLGPLAETSIPNPDLATQKTIADFLDREIARIDQLIEKRAAFAEKVDEARSALVADAISGRLLDSQDVRASGWLGNIPESWAFERAKFHFRERQDRSQTGDEELLTVSHLSGVTRRSEKDVNMFMAESNEGYKLVDPGDLVINTMWAWMGAMGVSRDAGLISPSYGVYRPVSGQLLPEFVDVMVRARPFIAEATRRSKGIHSSRLRLYPDAFLDMRVPIPPTREQKRLLAILRERQTKEDHLIAKNAAATELLREYRAALITTAVTGQIDVSTYGNQGATDLTLDRIEEEMGNG